MSRRVVVTSVLAVLGLVLAGLVVDSLVRARVEASVASQLGADLGATDADVAIGGFPFLAQLAGGTLGRVEVTAPSAVMDGVRIDDVEVELTGVSTGTPRTVDALSLRGDVDPASLAPLLPGGVSVRAEGERLVLVTELAGLRLEASAVPRADGRAVELEVDGLSVAGVDVDPDSLPFGLGDSLTGLSIPLDGLPAGVRLSSVTVAEGRIRVLATGVDLVLPQTSAGAAGLVGPDAAGHAGGGAGTGASRVGAAGHDPNGSGTGATPVGVAG